MNEISLVAGQKVNIEVKSDSLTEVITAEVKKYRDRLLAIILISHTDKFLDIPAGTPVKIKPLDSESPQIISGEIIETKAFPLIILKLEISKFAVDENHQSLEKEISEIIAETTDPSFISNRDSARTNDSFPVQYFPISKEAAEKMKEEYLLRPSHARTEMPPIDELGNEKDMLFKISHLGPELIDVLRDIYLKIEKISGQKEKKENIKKMDEKNVAQCIDISGSGLKIICERKFYEGDMLEIIISPPFAKPRFSISVIAKVKNVEKTQSNDKPVVAVGLKYYSIHEADMEEIIQYTFQLQKEQLSLRRLLKQRKSK